MLNGMQGEVDGKKYEGLMIPMAENDDEWIAAVLSYVRNSGDLGNNATVITPEEVKKVRAFTKIIPGGITLQRLEIEKGWRNTNRNWVE